jgi:radical SAM superfamily enzyme YgiQ (UPF0313 family)
LRQCLVIIPTTKSGVYFYGFSAPLCWLFSDNLEAVRGVYSFEVTKKLIQQYEYFIIEMNWYTTLWEFSLLVDYIKKTNKNSKILFGGLFSILKRNEIFKNFDVDYFIKGDNELPIKMFLSGDKLDSIPNFVSRHFENETTYSFQENEYDNIKYNLSWLPQYSELMKDSHWNGNDDDYNYPQPMIITSKGCSVQHNGCEYCFGSQIFLYQNNYKRTQVKMNSIQINRILSDIEKYNSRATLFFTSDPREYDFNREYDLDITAHIMNEIYIEKIKHIQKSFKRTFLLLPIHSDGEMGKDIIENYEEILELNNEVHRIRFLAWIDEKNKIKNYPEILFNLDKSYNTKDWNFNFYNDFDYSMNTSKKMYDRRELKFKKPFEW